MGLSSANRGITVSCERAMGQNTKVAASNAKNTDGEIARRRRFVASFLSICNLAEQDTGPQGRSSVKILRINQLVLPDTIEIK